MIDATDMSTPVTRGELRAELEQFEIRLEQKLDQKLAHLATKVELEMWGGALLARIEAGERLLKHLLERIDRSEQRLLAELAHHTRASHEEMSAQISAFDEKYADLPPRVSQLEAKVFRAKRS